MWCSYTRTHTTIRSFYTYIMAISLWFWFSLTRHTRGMSETKLKESLRKNVCVCVCVGCLDSFNRWNIIQFPSFRMLIMTLTVVIWMRVFLTAIATTVAVAIRPHSSHTIDSKRTPSMTHLMLQNIETTIKSIWTRRTVNIQWNTIKPSKFFFWFMTHKCTQAKNDSRRLKKKRRTEWAPTQ